MRSSRTRTGARRGGDDYQDMIALKLVVEMLEKDNFDWIRVEYLEAGSLDDIVARKKDGQYLYLQVKHSKHPLTWEVLLKRKQTGRKLGLSLLMSWFRSWKKIQELGPIEEAAVISNREASPELESTFGKCFGRIDYDKIIDPELTRKILEQLESEDMARDFFESFTFKLGQADLHMLEKHLRCRFEELGGSEEGWLSLKDAMRIWTREPEQPPPAGEITYEIAQRAAGWHQLRPLPQEFDVPTDYVLPENEFHEHMLKLIENGSGKCFFLTGPPGSGKSTYLSYLARHLKDRYLPVIRHHYFLSVHYRGEDRVPHQRVAESLMTELKEYYPASIGGHVSNNPRPDLGKWLDACGRHFAGLDNTLVLMIDGLDHVLRDGQFDEVRSLLNHLLPVPEGVTVLLGTQRLDTNLFPQKLLRYTMNENWIEIPPLGFDGVRQWVGKHSEELGIDPRARAYEESMSRIWEGGRREQELEFAASRREAEIDELARAFYSVSAGHPLHLRSALLYLLASGSPITWDTVKKVPSCPQRDIEIYYHEVWAGLTEAGRMILHLLAVCKFDWPKRGLIEVIAAQGIALHEVIETLRKMEHIVVETSSGIRPFHNSLTVFVEKDKDHSSYRKGLLETALGWLRSDTSSDRLRWLHEWNLQAELGDPTPAINGPCREWAIDAISKGYDANEIMRKLSSACQWSLEVQNPVNYLRVALLKDYVESIFESPEEALDLLLEPQLWLDRDRSLFFALKSHMNYLGPSGLVTLGRHAAAVNDEGSISGIIGHLNKRLKRPHTHPDTSLSFIQAQTVVAALQEKMDVSRAERFIIFHRQNGLSVRLLDLMSSELRRLGRQSMLESLLKLSFDDEERVPLERQAVLITLEQSMDLSSVISGRDTITPFGAIYMAISAPSSRAIPHIIPPKSHYERRESEPPFATRFLRKSRLSEFIYESFFYLAASYLTNNELQGKQWLAGLDILPWEKRLLRLLASIAEEIAEELSNNRPLSLSQIFHRFSEIPGRAILMDRHTVHVVWELQEATTRMALDVFSLSQFISGEQHPVICEDDLDVALNSGFCNWERFTDCYVRLDRQWMSENAVRWFLTYQNSVLSDSDRIYTFPERASDFSKMAILAARHEAHDIAAYYIHQSANNLLGYGYRKDILLRDILDTAVTCHKAGISEARDWILQLAPAIAKVTEFTDGAMTQSFPECLAEALSEVDTDLLMKYHRWLVTEGDRYTADAALDLLKKHAVSPSVGDREAPTPLIPGNKTDADDMGNRSLNSALSSLENGSSKKAILGENEQETDVSNFPPGSFQEYLRHLYNRLSYAHWKHLRVEEWLRYWTLDSGADLVFEVMDAAFVSGVRFNVSDMVLAKAMKCLQPDKAFEWLVRAHACDEGWRRDMGQFQQQSPRWTTVKNLYPKLWLKFMADSIRLEDEHAFGDYGKGRFQKMTLYCLSMGELEMARQIMRTVTAFALELVSPIKLPIPRWTLEKDGQSSRIGANYTEHGFRS